MTSAMPERVVVSQPLVTPKRHIWDLEGEDNGAADSALPTPAPSENAPLVLREADRMPSSVVLPTPQSAPAPPPAADAIPTRAKTRIIGFHAQDIDTQTPAEIAPGPVFPAGFLVVIDGPGRGAHFTVTTRVSSIGRADDQDVCLDFGDESISRTGHASVMYDAEQNCFFLGHGNKANAVRRNGMPVLATEKLEHGDDIRIGKTTLRFHAFCGPDFTWDETDES
jgi:pSer/pThr/pTyr-binding forkhead associated (FHA) protein